MPLVRFHFCAWVCRANAPGANPGGPVWDRPLRKTKSVPAVHPSRTWTPPRTKARFQPGGETPKGCRKLSGSGHRTETSQLSHPRLCVDQPRRPNWRPRKMGVQGGASTSDGAKPHSICGSPLAVLWLLSARQKVPRPAGRNRAKRRAGSWPRPASLAPCGAIHLLAPCAICNSDRLQRNAAGASPRPT